MDKDFICSTTAGYAYIGKYTYYEGLVLNKYDGKDENVVIPDGVVIISRKAFVGKRIKSITFPESFSPMMLEKISDTDLVKRVIFLANNGFERIDVSGLMECFPNLEEVEFPNVEKVGFYIFTSLHRWPAFRFTGPINRIYADRRGSEHPRKKRITLFAPDITPGRVDEAYRPSLIETFVEHPEWYDSKQTKTYTEWLKKNLAKFAELCGSMHCMPLIIRCISLEGMRLSASTYDSLIELAEKRNDTELKGVLIQEKTKNHDLEKLRRRKETQDYNDMDDPLRPHAMKKIWSWSILADGLSLTKFKGIEEALVENSVYVPETIGDKPVVCVSGQVFWESKIREIVFPETIESIRGNMCAQNDCLETVTIQGKIRSIPYFCFADCPRLTGVDLPGNGLRIGAPAAGNGPVSKELEEEPQLIIGMGAFENCKSIPSLSLTGTMLGVESFMNSGIETLSLKRTPVIPGKCFSGCRSLKTADLRDVVFIDHEAFKGCGKLTDVHVSGVLRYIQPGAFSKCETLTTIHLHNVEEPDYIRKLFCEGKEKDSSNLRLVIEEAAKSEHAYEASTHNIGEPRDPSEGTSWIWIPNEDDTVHIERKPRLSARHVDDDYLRIPACIQDKPVVFVSDGAFSKSSTMKIDLPETVTYIGKEAFFRLNTLESVSISGKIKYIPERCFAECNTLSFVDLNAYHIWIGKPYPEAQKHSGNLNEILVFGKRSFESCLEIHELNLDNVVLLDGAFRKTNVCKVVLHNIPVVPICCFMWCNMLAEADLRGVVDIQYNAFQGCNNLREIHLSDEIEIINSSAFCNCVNLKKVHLHGVRHPELVKKLFTPMKRFGVTIEEYVIHDDEIADGSKET